jgi:hypothetical protein
MKAVIFAVLVFATAPALAQPAASEDDERSELLAFSLSAVPTVASVVVLKLAYDMENSPTQTSMAVGGLLALAIGPTVGHFYAGEIWSDGLRLRIGGVAVAAGGVALSMATCLKIDRWCEGFFPTAGLVGILGGGAMFASGAVWEIFGARNAAKRHNARHDDDDTIAFVPTAGGSPGVSLVGTF